MLWETFEQDAALGRVAEQRGKNDVRIVQISGLRDLAHATHDAVIDPDGSTREAAGGRRGELHGLAGEDIGEERIDRFLEENSQWRVGGDFFLPRPGHFFIFRQHIERLRH